MKTYNTENLMNNRVAGKYTFTFNEMNINLKLEQSKIYLKLSTFLLSPREKC